MTVRVGLIGKRLTDGVDDVTKKPYEGFERIGKIFETKNPNIKVEWVPIPSGGGPSGWQARCLTLLMSGDVDLIESWGLYSYASQGLLEKLDSYIARDNYDMNRFVPQCDEVVKWWAPGRTRNFITMDYTGPLTPGLSRTIRKYSKRPACLP